MASELRLECKFQMAELESQLRDLKAQVEALERRLAAASAAVPSPAPTAARVPTPATPDPPEIQEEILLAISAAVAAFLGKRGHIRQIRLASSMAWAQQGRASIQASHGIVVQR